MNTINRSLYDLVCTLDNTARIAALRGLTHSTMAKCIGAIRQDIRDRAREARNEDIPQNDLDQRNGTDEDNRDPNYTKTAMGFSVDVPPLKQASMLHAAYALAANDLETLRASKWDAALSPKAMLEFMTKNAQKLDQATAAALAEAVGCDTTTIEKMHELQAQREREQLIESTPEILLTFSGFGDNGFAEALDNLPPILQHQLGVKVVESLDKARNQVLNRVIRTKKLSDLASIPLLKDAIEQVSEWVKAYEHIHSDEIAEAIDAGRAVRTLEDVISF